MFCLLYSLAFLRCLGMFELHQRVYCSHACAFWVSIQEDILEFLNSSLIKICPLINQWIFQHWSSNWTYNFHSMETNELLLSIRHSRYMKDITIDSMENDIGDPGSNCGRDSLYRPMGNVSFNHEGSMCEILFQILRELLGKHLIWQCISSHKCS